MAYPIFPVSPLPAALSRTKDWGENVVFYDSGESQGTSPYLKPLYQYDIPMPLYLDTKQNSIWSFYDDIKGMTKPFLMKDPYDFQVASAIAVRSGIISGASLFLCDVKSFMIRADTTSIGSLFSVASGYVRLGVEYNYSQDKGIITVNTKVVGDVWSLRNATYFKKVKFTQQYAETAKLWGIFATDFQIKEVP